MINSIYLFQVIIALGLLNVWLLRFNKATNYRGGDSKNLLEEFAVYGLPEWFCYFVGALKVTSAMALLAGFLYPQLIFPAAAVISTLMLGAVAMHFKVGDSVKKTFPAFLMLLMSVLVCLSNIY